MDVAGKHIVVMGLGRFGGGIGVTRWLAEQGAKVTVTDRDSSANLAESVAKLNDLPVAFHLGGHDPADLDECDLLVVSPAVQKETNAFVAEAMSRGIPLTSEMNLFIERCPAKRIVGITGSAGKSTTTAMLGAILHAACPADSSRRAWVGGNIGQSLLGDLKAMTPDDIVALELSSFQLEDSERLRWSPQYALITNIQPNHLDRHGTLEAYASAKLNIVRYQKQSDIVFVSQHDEELAQRVRSVGAVSQLQRYAFPPLFSTVLRVPGSHNRDNAAAAIAVARALGIDDRTIAAGLTGFTGLPHRLELVAESNGVRYFNDSKSTTPESTRIALDAFEEPVIMLVGGRGKGIPFDELTRQLATRAKAVICYGETRDALLNEIKSHYKGGPFKAEPADNIEHAVTLARNLGTRGDVIVLSPACTSYDMFRNYEHRGDTFRQIVQNLAT